MRRNAVAWAALVVSAAALAGPRFMNKPVGAVQEIPAEGQKAARALSEAFGAVADFVRPSVVQITVQKKAGGLRMPGGQGQGRGVSRRTPTRRTSKRCSSSSSAPAEGRSSRISSSARPRGRARASSTTTAATS